MADPITIGGILYVLGSGLGQNMNAHLDDEGRKAWDATPTVFPVGQWRGYLPTRSQEYRAPDHHGCDIMFPRRNGGEDLVYPAGSVNGSKNFFMPDKQLCYAVKDGYIWSSGSGPTGLIVVIDHGKPFATCYIHMDSLLIPSGISNGQGHVQVRAGQPIGTIGYSPRDAAKLKHLHFECWYKGGAESHIDPWPLIEHAPLPAQTEDVA